MATAATLTGRILVADRNPHIRAFLKRELTASGYSVRPVSTGKDLLNAIYGPDPIDLLVLDPDFPGSDPADIARKLADRIPALPVIIYAIPDNDGFSDAFPGHPSRVDKDGQSVERLKDTIRNMLFGTDRM